MTVRDIIIKSVLSEERASNLIGILAIKNKDDFHISKMIEYANKGFTNMQILQAFCDNDYWVELHPLK